MSRSFGEFPYCCRVPHKIDDATQNSTEMPHKIVPKNHNPEALDWKQKESKRWEACSCGRSSPVSLDVWDCVTTRQYSRLLRGLQFSSLVQTLGNRIRINTEVIPNIFGKLRESITFSCNILRTNDTSKHRQMTSNVEEVIPCYFALLGFRTDF